MTGVTCLSQDNIHSASVVLGDLALGLEVLSRNVCIATVCKGRGQKIYPSAGPTASAVPRSCQLATSQDPDESIVGFQPADLARNGKRRMQKDAVEASQ